MKSVIGLIGAAVLFGSMGCSGQDGEFYSEQQEQELGTTSQALGATGSMPAARFNQASCVIDDNGTDKMLVFGGQDGGGSVVSDTFLYDPGAGTWSTKSSLIDADPLTPMPAITRGEMRQVPGTETCILFGGSNGANALDRVFVYDVSIDEWKELNSLNIGGSLPRVDFEVSVCGAPNGASTKYILVGGRSTLTVGSAELNRIDVYDPAANSGAGALTASGVTLTDERADFALAPNDNTFDQFFVAGGVDSGNNILSNIELITTSSICGSASKLLAVVSSGPTRASIDQRSNLTVFPEGSADTFIVTAGDNAGTPSAVSYEVVVNFANGQSTTVSADDNLAAARTKAIAVPRSGTVGEVFLVGGEEGSPLAASNKSEAYDPAASAGAGAFAAPVTLVSTRKEHRVEFLPSANIAVVAGGRNSSNTVLSSAETLP